MSDGTPCAYPGCERLAGGRHSLCWAHAKREQRAAGKLRPIRPYREPLSEKLTRLALEFADAEEDEAYAKARRRLWNMVYALAERLLARREQGPQRRRR